MKGCLVFGRWTSRQDASVSHGRGSCDGEGGERGRKGGGGWVKRALMCEVSYMWYTQLQSTFYILLVRRLWPSMQNLCFLPPSVTFCSQWRFLLVVVLKTVIRLLTGFRKVRKFSQVVVSFITLLLRPAAQKHTSTSFSENGICEHVQNILWRFTFFKLFSNESKSTFCCVRHEIRTNIEKIMESFINPINAVNVKTMNQSTQINYRSERQM